MSKFEHKVVRKFTLETKKSMHCLCPTNKANACGAKMRLTLNEPI